jgi:hypothetical protein
LCGYGIHNRRRKYAIGCNAPHVGIAALLLARASGRRLATA